VRREIERGRKEGSAAILALQQAWTRLAYPKAGLAAHVGEVLQRLLGTDTILREAQERAGRGPTRLRSTFNGLGHTLALLVVLPSGWGLHYAMFVRSYGNEPGECNSFAACGFPGLWFFLIVFFGYVMVAFVLPRRARLRQRKLMNDAHQLVMRELRELHAAAEAIEAEYRAGRNFEIDLAQGGAT
jgi:hypothetical protein